MSNESDSEEFYDAEDATPIRIHRNSDKRHHSKDTIFPPSVSTIDDEVFIPENEKPLKDSKNEGNFEKNEILQNDRQLVDKKEAEKRAQELERKRKKLEMRRYLLEEDDFPTRPVSSETSSINSADTVCSYPGFANQESALNEGSISSVEGLANIMDKFENDTLSKEFAQSQETSCIKPNVPLIDVCDTSSSGDYYSRTDVMPEPDVVASTKGKPPDIEIPSPIAPPRRKKKGRKAFSNSTFPTTPPIPSPATTVENLTRELEESLDLKSAASGEKVVKPQDLEPNKAEGPPPSEPLEGEENKGPEINPMMRTRSNSGRLLSDMEILESIMVLNLDTGERIPLSLAEERLPKCINPLSLHIMRLTSEYVSNSSLNKNGNSDEESSGVPKNSQSQGSNMRRKGIKIKKLIGKTVEKTVNKIKHVADEVLHGEDSSSSDDELPTEARRTIKLKASSSHKGPYVFDQLRLVQDLEEHTGAVWTMKFSYCGRLLASAGQDNQLRIWVLKDAYSYFDDMRQKYQTEVKVSPAPSQESLGSHHSAEEMTDTGTAADSDASEDSRAPFMKKPFCVYSGHTADLLDVSWSKNYFILSSSMDKTVRLWHISRKECLCCFQHIDFVTAIAFHPRDDRYFLSGSLDGKLRLWNIPDKKVALWNEVDSQTKLITAANFCQNGKFAVVGTYDGRCIFYNTEQLKYYTQIHCRSSRGKNAKGRKISGIEPLPGEDKVLVTSNDSRIRLYDLRDLSLTSKYRGCSNSSSQIKASFSHDGKYIVCGSEDRYVYIWKTYHDYSKFSSARRDRNDFWESIKAHNALVTAAIFAPNPNLIFKQMEKEKPSEDSESKAEKTKETKGGEVLVTADFSGIIKVFFNKPKSKLLTSASLGSVGSASSAT